MDVPDSPQRRLLTVLFSDLTGSTRLSEQLNVEDLHSSIHDFLSSCTEIIEDEGGYVARYMGDGILAYFGYPTAMEGAANRAVAAALRIREYVSVTPALVAQDVGVRSGISTGNVVVGDILGSGPAQERSAVGETPNMAARLQAVAGPNRIFVSETTRRLAEPYFHFVDAGLFDLKGFSEKKPAFEVLDIRAKPSHSLAPNHQPSDFVGRSAEFHELNACLQMANSGHGKLVGIVGEGGIGKTRLVQEFREASKSGPAVWLEASASPQLSRIPFAMMRQFVDPDRAKTDISSADKDRDLKPSSTASLLDMHVQNYLLAINDSFGGKPTVFLFEDLHWADRATLELLSALSHIISRQPWLVLYTSRNPIPGKLRGHGTFVQLELKPLDADANAALIKSRVGERLPDRILQELVDRSGGIPLYSNELSTWSLNGTREEDLGGIPDSLSELLLAKIDAVGNMLPLAQVAAVLGDNCHIELANTMLEANIGDLKKSVVALRDSGILKSSDVDDADRMVFAHALFQEAAYLTLLKQQRDMLHRRAAELLNRLEPVGRDRRAIVRHLIACGEDEKAISLLIEIGETEHQAGEYLTAQSVLEEALEVLKKHRAGPSRDIQELRLQTALASVLQVTVGYAASPTVAATTKAAQLAERLGVFEQNFQQATGKWMAASSAGKFAEAATLSNHVLSLALSQGEPKLIGIGRMTQLTALCRLARLDSAEDAFRQGAPYFETEQFRQLPGAIPQTFGNAAIVALLRGDVGGARNRAATALGSGRASATPYDQVFARYMVGMYAILQGAYPLAGRLSKSAFEIARAMKFPQFEATSRIVLGRAMAMLVDASQGAAEIRSGLDAMKVAASTVGQSMYLSWLAEAERFCGCNDAAIKALDRAMEVNPEELFYRPETLRLRGILYIETGDRPRGIDMLQEALHVANAQGANWFVDRVKRNLASLPVR